MRVDIYLTGTLLRGRKELCFYSGDMDILPRVGEDFWVTDRRMWGEEWEGLAKLKVSKVCWLATKNFSKADGSSPTGQVYVEIYVEQEEPIKFT